MTKGCLHTFDTKVPLAGILKEIICDVPKELYVRMLFIYPIGNNQNV